jgi:hypothetical protein
MSKYRNKKCVCDGLNFDSLKEMRRYKELMLLYKAGKIDGLVLQPTFLLQDKFKHEGKGIRKIEYIADFMYRDHELGGIKQKCTD